MGSILFNVTFFTGAAPRVDTILAVLLGTAKSGPEPTITYTQLASECAAIMALPNVDFNDPSERQLFSHLLGEAADKSMDLYQVMLTLIIIYKSGDLLPNGTRTAMVRNKLIRANATDDEFQSALFNNMRAVWKNFSRVRRS